MPRTSGAFDATAAPSEQAEEFKQWMRVNLPPPPLDDSGVETMRRSYDALGPRPLRPYRTRGNQVHGIAIEWVMADGASPRDRILMPHGGAFVSGSKQSHRGMAFLLSEATGAAVLMFEHRLAPEHPFPAAIDDTETVYRWMLAHGPDGAEPAHCLAVIGDSAGGNLTCGLLMRARAHGLTLPHAAATMSAWNDLSDASESRRTRDGIDPFLTTAMMRFCADRYLGGHGATDPYASPVYGDYAGLPPLLMQVGDEEILRDDSVRSHARAITTGCDATLQVWPGMFHTWQFWADIVPEGARAVGEIGAFVKSHWSRS